MKLPLMTTSWVLIICCLVGAAQAKPELQNDEEREQALKKALREAFPGYSLSYATGIENRLLLFKSDLLSVSFNDREFYSSLQIDFSGLAKIPKLNFSFFVNDPYSFCPALENIVLPRTSLNIDPIIGKYYWEW